MSNETFKDEKEDSDMPKVRGHLRRISRNRRVRVKPHLRRRKRKWYTFYR